MMKEKLALIYLLLLRLKNDVRAVSATNAIAAFLVAVIIIIAGINVAPIVATEVQTIIAQNASSWNFTGYQGARALMGLIPFIFIAGIVLATIGVVFVFARKSD